MSLPHWFDRFRMPITIVEFSLDPNVDTKPRGIDPNGNVLVKKMPPTSKREDAEDLPQETNLSRYRRGMQRDYKWEIDTGDGITVTASQVSH